MHESSCIHYIQTVIFAVLVYLVICDNHEKTKKIATCLIYIPFSYNLYCLMDKIKTQIYVYLPCEHLHCGTRKYSDT